MKVSIEISMYPLDPDFKTFILDYIERLHSYKEIKVISNTMSTQVFGEYDRLTEILSIENKRSLSAHPAMVIVSKLINADLRP